MADGGPVGGISNADLLSMQKGGGGGGGGGEDLKVNEEDIGGLVEKGLDSAPFKIAKIAMAIPILGWLLQTFFPMNPGKASLFAGVDSPEGFVGKQIRPGGGGPQGGFLAKIAGELMKNSAITDHTGGVGGGGEGGGSGGGGGEGGGGGGGEGGGHGGHGFDSHSAFAFAGMEGPAIAAGGGNRFDYSDISRDMLGDLRPSFTPSMGGQGMGADMGIG